jgi:hypothetical protein
MSREVGLKRKFLFSYFCENFVSLFAKKGYESFRKNEKFRKTKLCESLLIFDFLENEKFALRFYPTESCLM